MRSAGYCTTVLDMALSTPTQKLADALLDVPLEDFVHSRRPQRAWRLIARDLYEATGGQVDVTDVTLASWFAEPARAAS